MKFTFAKPYKFEGQEYTELDVNYEDLSAQDIITVQKKYKNLLKGKEQYLSGNLMALTGDTDFIIFVLANITSMPLEFFKGLPYREFGKMYSELAGFLSASE